MSNRKFFDDADIPGIDDVLRTVGLMKVMKVCVLVNMKSLASH